MRANGVPIDAAALATQERGHLEADWRRAWESCSNAAQAGDYAEAERWHRQAILLGNTLVASDRVLGEPSRLLATSH